MAIPEAQLETWSNRGAEQGSRDTIASVINALQSHNWPIGIEYDLYLQGSYPNETNIRGDSDVDIVAELTSTFYHDVTDEPTKRALGFRGGAAFGFDEFKQEVITALTNYYNAGTVVPGNKSIKIRRGTTNRLDADVVPCAAYRQYQGTTVVAEGIKFWTRSGHSIVNYPKIHEQNGHFTQGFCQGDYKGAIRIFKNARSSKAEVSDIPSYFIEGLCYNLSNNCYAGNRQQTILNCLNELHAAKNNGSLNNFTAQNGLQNMFGSQSHQIQLADGEQYIWDMVNLWNNW